MDRLLAEWDVRLLEPLTISCRDDQSNVIDGQHRASAIQKMNSGQDVTVRCVEVW